jgi:type VI protein secretion system component VasF
MDHHEQHHQHHEKERQEHIQREKERERESDKAPARIHPAWFITLGAVLVLVVVLSWILRF